MLARLGYDRSVLQKIALLVFLSLLTACGGGGGKGAAASGAGSTSLDLPFPLSVVLQNARFLLFPNAQRNGFSGTEQINTVAYATAYYTAIDAANERTTKTAWMAKNGFGSGTGTQITAVFGDQEDLGYGRRMTARRNVDGSIAIFVDNYLVETGSTGYTYNSLNVDAAVVQSAQRFVSTSAIEFSDINGTGAGDKFVKFYVFDKNGNRLLMVDQDGLGEKAMPGICTSCHGGRADRLTATGLFPIVGNGLSQQRGDTTSRLQSLKVHTFDFSALTDPTTSSVRTRASQEANMKIFNQWVHESYATTGINEWDGAIARTLIETMYGGAGFPSATYQDNAVKSFVPSTNWTTSGQAGLYQNVVGPSCMTCHILRGTKNQDDIAFTTFTQFDAYADRVKAHVFDRGNMPLLKLIFDDFWASSSTQPQLLAAVPSIAAQGGSASLKPGRPIADPGPDRFVKQGALSLSAVNSLYASSFSWSIITNPASGMSLSSAANQRDVTFNITADGTYVVRLTASGNGITSSKDVTIQVDNAAAPANTVTFTDIKTELTSCQAGCHQGNGLTLSTTAIRPPLSYDAADYANDDEFYATVKSRINFNDVVASPLLRKPAGKHHGGALQAQFDISTPLGDPARRKYDLFVTWMMQGAPQ